MVVARVALDGLHHLAMAEDLELDVGVLTLELEAIDADAARALEPPGVPLPEENREGDRDDQSRQREDDSEHGRVFDSTRNMAKAVERRHEVIERGGIDILYRPRVEREEVDSLHDVQRLLLLLCPDGRHETRVIAIGRKELSARFWGFVDIVDDPQYVDATLDSYTYLTKTRGARHLPAARVAASGEYVISRHGSHTHLAFTTTPRPDREIDVASEGNFIVSVANPDPAVWGLPELPPLQDELFPEYEVHVTIPTPFPAAIQERFRGRRYIDLEPELLDYPGAELIFVDTRLSGGISDVERDLEDRAEE
jgi:hypothetical protein